MMTQNISNSTQYEQAKKSLDHYKQICLYSRLFTSNHFLGLKTEIDTAFALREQTAVMKRNWLQLISYVEAHESVCVKLTGKHSYQCDLINQDEETLLQKYSSNWNELLRLLDEKTHYIETKLFQNKTFLFLTEYNCALEIFDKIDTELDTPGKLICIQNEYFTTDDLALLKK